MAALVKLPLKPWQQPKVSLCWRDLTAIGADSPYATNESVLERGVCVCHFCVQEGKEKYLTFCTPRKNVQDASALMLVLNFICSAASEGLCTVKTLIISLGLLPWKHNLWTCKFCLPGGNQCMVSWSLLDTWFVFFPSVLQTSIFMHCEAWSIEISPAPGSWTGLKRHFFSRKKGMILGCDPDLHLSLEAWIYLCFTCTDPHNSWKDLCFFRTNMGQ